MTKAVKLSNIRTSEGTQVRETINEETVASYAEAMLDAGNKFPPIVVFDDGNGYVLADGFHRVLAAVRNQFMDIVADVRKGTRVDALAYALGANVAHGLRRTNADKRRSVEMALKEWPSKSDRELANICAVSHPFVADVRSQVETITTSKREGKDGKSYPAKKPAKAAQPDLREPGDGKATPETATDKVEQITPDTAGNRAAPANVPDRSAEFRKACGNPPPYDIATFIESVRGEVSLALEFFDHERLAQCKREMLVELGRIETKLKAHAKAERAAELQKAA